MKHSRRKSEKSLARLWVSPAIIIVLSVTIFPMFWSLYNSMYHITFSMGKMTYQWNGGNNYLNIITSPRFWNSIKNVLYFGGVGTSIQLIFGMLIALIIFNFIKVWKQVFVLSLFIIPMSTAPVVTGFLWRFFFDPTYSTINAIFSIIGIKGISWFSSNYALTSVMIADIWQWTSLPLLLFYAARSSLPEDIYDSAKIDGASYWTTFWNITMPLLKNVIVIAFMLRVMDSYKFFDSIYVMTQGGPGVSTEVPSLYTYLTAFQSLDIGQATALTWILSLGALLMFNLVWGFFKRG